MSTHDLISRRTFLGGAAALALGAAACSQGGLKAAPAPRHAQQRLNIGVGA